MALTLLCALGVLLDPWTLRPDLSATAKSSWNVTINVSMNGSHQNATASLVEAIQGPADASGLFPAHIAISDITSETGEAAPDSEADGNLNAQNVIQSAKDDDGDRRMFAPLLFTYPTKPVNVGDSWTIDVKPSLPGAVKMTYTFTAKSVEQENGSDVLLVTSTVKEDSTDGVSASGQWWLAKDGKVTHFKLDIKQWHVMIEGGVTIDAVVTGKNKHLTSGLR